MEKITIRTKRRVEFVDITSQVQSCVGRSGIKDGICYVYVPHTTAGITINENADPSVVRDIIAFLYELVHPDAGYTHIEGNSDAHIKSSIIGNCVTVFVEDNKLALGTWQGIYFTEFDGPRTRNVWVKVVGK